ncbi:MAG: hypothetical protein R3Y24_06020 [Eubacteriales bacterium]
MKKAIVICSILIIIALIFWGLLYSVGYIPIIGNMIATEKINDYATEVYGNDESIDVGYDFYNMGNYNTDEYSYILNIGRIIDHNLYENAGEETPYKQDYQKIIDMLEEGINFEDYSISCTIDADDYSRKYYTLVVYNLSNENVLSENESLTKPAEVVMQFVNSMDTKYNFTSVNVVYNDNNGKKQISLNGDTAITEDILVQSTKNIE